MQSKEDAPPYSTKNYDNPRPEEIQQEQQRNRIEADLGLEPRRQMAEPEEDTLPTIEEETPTEQPIEPELPLPQTTKRRGRNELKGLHSGLNERSWEQTDGRRTRNSQNNNEITMEKEEKTNFNGVVRDRENDATIDRIWNH